LGLLLRGRRGRFRASRVDLRVNLSLDGDGLLGKFRPSKSGREGHLFSTSDFRTVNGSCRYFELNRVCVRVIRDE